MACVADSSFLVSLLDKDDKKHEDAKRVAAKHEVIHVPGIILAETLSVIYGDAKDLRLDGHATAVASLDALAAAPNMALDSPMHDHEATTSVWRNHPELSYSDAAAVVAARAKAVDLCTFDKKQMRAFRSG